MAGFVTDLQTYAQLRSAIEKKRLVQLSYKGARRVVEPHDYGIHGGRERLFGYQLRSDAPRSDRKVEGWRLLDVDKIKELVVLDDTFAGSRADPHQQHLVWDVVYGRVD
jgi:predicted DNA-binding transcriptional regulator YafY